MVRPTSLAGDSSLHLDLSRIHLEGAWDGPAPLATAVASGERAGGVRSE